MVWIAHEIFPSKKDISLSETFINRGLNKTPWLIVVIWKTSESSSENNIL